MAVSDETRLFNRNADEGENAKAALILQDVYAALKEAGHNPIIQLVGYLLSGEPTYITSRRNARKTVSGIERDELLEELVRYYVKHKGL